MIVHYSLYSSRKFNRPPTTSVITIKQLKNTYTYIILNKIYLWKRDFSDMQNIVLMDIDNRYQTLIPCIIFSIYRGMKNVTYE